MTASKLNGYNGRRAVANGKRHNGEVRSALRAILDALTGSPRLHHLVANAAIAAGEELEDWNQIDQIIRGNTETESEE